MTKPLLILDLDETLIHSCYNPVEGRKPDLAVGRYSVYARPHLGYFLLQCHKIYRLAIWSSAGELYIKRAVNGLREKCFWPKSVELEFIWSREQCTQWFDPEWRETKWIKPLRKVKRNRTEKLNQVLIVDNDPYKCAKNYGNAIYVRDFLGQDSDEELYLLSHYLRRIVSEPDFRQIEKRGWRAKTADWLNKNRK